MREAYLSHRRVEIELAEQNPSTATDIRSEPRQVAGRISRIQVTLQFAQPFRLC